MESMEIKGLFKRFNYKIDINTGGVTIITGPNGFGKSTIIKCMNALGNSDVDFFFELPFNEIIVGLKDKQNFYIQKKDNKLFIDDQEIDRELFRVRTKLIYKKNNVDYNGVQDKITRYNQIINKMQQITGQICIIEEQRLVEERRISEERRLVENEEVQYAVPDIIIKGRGGVVDAVQLIPHKILREIRDAAGKYSQFASGLDSTFPERLLNEREGISEGQFHLKMNQMKERAEKLNKYGISNIHPLPNVEFKSDDARALKVYFEDFEEKYKQYEELINKLEQFSNVVNKRFIFTQMEISSKKGILIVEKTTKEKIDLKKLSSGEKETLILFYKLIFEVPDGAVLLLDEPEISLHIAWQRMFSEDLFEIAANKHLTIIVATHSPQMINGHRDVQIDLGELYKNDNGLNN